MNRLQSLVVGLAIPLAAACDVESKHRDTHGIDVGDASGASQPDGGNADADAGAPAAPAVRGYVVIDTDYQSTVVSLLSAEGDVASASFIASGSADPGLSAPLSGDVVPPTMIVPGPEVVLLDRYPASVLTWVDLSTAKVRAQLSVAQGFASNPHDYAPYSATKAFVPRYEPNLASGKKPFDSGNDVLVIDPSVPEIEASIDLMPALAGEPSGFYPRADRALFAGGKLRVLCVGYNSDFTKNIDSRIVTIDPDSESITDVLVFKGMKGCGTLALSPDGARLAVACEGSFGEDPSTGFPDAGVLVLDVAEKLAETNRFTSVDLGVRAQVGTVEWTGPTTLLFSTLGRFDSDQKTPLAEDTVRFLDTDSGEVASAVLLQSKTTPFSLGDIRCSVRQGLCLVSDAETNGGVLQRFTIGANGAVSLKDQVKVDTGLGLPPHNIGEF
ncbi:MAG TPA: hypothetical protein VHC69_34820 [Polyangiaceae bacterium]|nr:hypothetical protein [Polyangiaceae bacterium]